MKSKLSQFHIAFLLLISLALSFHAFGQRNKNKNKRPDPKTQGREVLINQMGGGSTIDGSGKLWAVVIGVSSYKNLAAKSQLQFAHRDAEDIAAFLRSPNGGGYP
jgi:hypothetical protein